MQSKLVAAKDYHEVALDIPAFVPDQARPLCKKSWTGSATRM